MPWGISTKIPAVLIVEDEPLIRIGAVHIIEDAGFEVVEAASADEAIRILECRGDIRVVFTDIHMPGSMDGLKLAHAVRNRWPPIKIIVTSGREQIAKQDLPEGGRFFAKPYDQIEISERITRVGTIRKTSIGGKSSPDGIGLSLAARTRGPTRWCARPARKKRR